MRIIKETTVDNEVL